MGSEIYGLEMPALLAIPFRPSEQLLGRNVTFRIDATDAFEALVKNTANPTAIAAMSHVGRHRLYQLAITPWFELAPGAKNIADVPTRNDTFPYKIARFNEFGDLREIHDLVKKAGHALESGRPTTTPATL